MRVYSVVRGHSRFLNMQAALWRKFCPTLSELIVVNCGPDFDEIDRACYWNDIRTVRYAAQAERQMRSRAAAIDFALHAGLPCTEPFLFIDSDVFPIKEFAAVQEDIAGWWRYAEHWQYPWLGALYLGNTPKREELFITDAPGSIPVYIEDHLGLSLGHWEYRAVRAGDLPPGANSVKARLQNFKVLRGSLLHTGNGSNWRAVPDEAQSEKEEFVHSLLENVGNTVLSDRKLLHMVTPVTTPARLAAVAASIPREVRWWLVYDGKLQSVPDSAHAALSCDAGGRKDRLINTALDAIKTGYVCVLPDDTAVHPQFWQTLQPLLQTPGKAFYFGCDKREAYAQPKEGHIFVEQCVVDRELIGDLRFGRGGGSAGRFFEMLHAQSPRAWSVLSEPLCYHEKLLTA